MKFALKLNGAILELSTIILTSSSNLCKINKWLLLLYLILLNSYKIGMNVRILRSQCHIFWMICGFIFRHKCRNSLRLYCWILSLLGHSLSVISRISVWMINIKEFEIINFKIKVRIAIFSITKYFIFDIVRYLYCVLAQPFIKLPNTFNKFLI